ncbi:hypothetical protein GGX14DRAFT_383894 [Mycena pura]|uniref:Uncharacterized protein n=1 Tax=Mycena pura TaxID=153505 RepID=A0AAD6YUB1_9AGAR|nr:hypothetical protein GGX14DRAFT_383894 [Mycena pura]
MRQTNAACNVTTSLSPAPIKLIYAPQSWIMHASVSFSHTSFKFPRFLVVFPTFQRTSSFNNAAICAMRNFRFSHALNPRSNLSAAVSGSQRQSAAVGGNSHKQNMSKYHAAAVYCGKIALCSGSHAATVELLAAAIARMSAALSDYKSAAMGQSDFDAAALTLTHATSIKTRSGPAEQTDTPITCSWSAGDTEKKTCCINETTVCASLRQSNSVKPQMRQFPASICANFNSCCVSHVFACVNINFLEESGLNAFDTSQELQSYHTWTTNFRRNQVILYHSDWGHYTTGGAVRTLGKHIGAFIALTSEIAVAVIPDNRIWNTAIKVLWHRRRR